MSKAKCLCDKCKVVSCDKKKSLAKRKQGKTNRNTGRYAEKLFQKWCESRGIMVSATVMSGKHKELANQVTSKKYMFSGDFHIEGLTSKRLKVEVKKRQLALLQKYYAATKFGDVCHIQGFCFVVSGEMFTEIVCRHKDFNYVPIDDIKHALLHSFFDQDNADIVAMIAKDGSRYLDFVFAIKENVFHKLLKEKE